MGKEGKDELYVRCKNDKNQEVIYGKPKYKGSHGHFTKVEKCLKCPFLTRPRFKDISNPDYEERTLNCKHMRNSRRRIYNLSEIEVISEVPRRELVGMTEEEERRYSEKKKREKEIERQMREENARIIGGEDALEEIRSIMESMGVPEEYECD